MKSIIDSDGCYICGYPFTEEHHIFGGANRKNSEEYGLKVKLCHRHHQDHKEGVHHNKELMTHLHEVGQREFEKTHSREEFIKIFGRNYLD